MKQNRPDLSVWRALLAAYEQMQVPDHRAAANIAGVPITTAQKAWKDGWPAAGMLPLREVIEKERLKARALRYRTEERMRERVSAELESAVDDAAASRAIEGVMAREAQLIAHDLLSKCRDMARAAAPLADSVVNALVELGQDSAASKQAEKIAKLRMVMDFTDQAMRLAKQAMDLETIHMGRDSTERTLLSDDAKEVAAALTRKLATVYGVLPAPRLAAPAVEIVVEAEEQAPVEVAGHLPDER